MAMTSDHSVETPAAHSTGTTEIAGRSLTQIGQDIAEVRPQRGQRQSARGGLFRYRERPLVVTPGRRRMALLSGDARQGLQRAQQGGGSRGQA